MRLTQIKSIEVRYFSTVESKIKELKNRIRAIFSHISIKLDEADEYSFFPDRKAADPDDKAAKRRSDDKKDELEASTAELEKAEAEMRMSSIL